MKPKSTRKRHSRKAAIDRPPKPYPDFPLGPANNGRWQKKINGTIHYFGKWGHVVNGKLVRIEPEGCWQAALAEYEQKREALYAGRTPRVQSDGLTVGELRGRFLTAKSRALDAGEITARTYVEYRATADRLMVLFGEDRRVDDLASDDFEALRANIAKTWGPVRLGNEVQRVRTVFKYGYEAGLIDKPIRFGPAFKKPAKHVLRKHRATNGERMFQASQVRALLDAASPQLKAMILLGINAGFGNADCGSLPLSALDLDGGWITFPRPKTGIARRCPLWSETADALKAVIAERPAAKDPADAALVFVTKYGHRWVRTEGEKRTPIDSVLQEFSKLLRELKLKRSGIGFYALRHTFRTVADATRDFPAVRLIMGHADASIDAVYREHIDASRLRAVADHVHTWLFGTAEAK
jgi:integrase